VHHSQYDSTTSQHKNPTPGELIEAKRRLEQAVAEGRCTGGTSASKSGRDTDRKSLDNLIALMTSTKAMRFLCDANFRGWSFGLLEVEGLDSLLGFNGAEHEFIDPDLEVLRKDLLAASETFLSSLARNTRPTVHTPGYRAVPQDDGFDETVRALGVATDKVCAIYDELVRIGQMRLAL
jgi:hypothetical protein